jgi:hypothetical protein
MLLVAWTTVWSLFCFNSVDGTWRRTDVHVPTLLQAVCGLPVHCIANTVCSGSESAFVVTGIGIRHQISVHLESLRCVVVVTLYRTWSRIVWHSIALQALTPFSNTAFYFNYLFKQKCLGEKFLGLLASWYSSITLYSEENAVLHEVGLFSASIEKWGLSRQSCLQRF